MDVSLEMIALYDCSWVMWAQWVGYLIPSLPWPNDTSMSPWVLEIGAERFVLPPGDLEAVVWERLTAQKAA